jgi:hypothetical protein
MRVKMEMRRMKMIAHFLPQKFNITVLDYSIIFYLIDLFCCK